MSRGRPSEQPPVLKEKWTLECYDVPSKPELGGKQVWYFDRSKNPHGPWRVENTPPKGYKHPKVKVVKNQSYGGMPVVMVFKTSNRSNAKTKMKVWNNTNIDYICSADNLPGVPDNAIILELGVGKSFIDAWKSKYKL